MPIDFDKPRYYHLNAMDLGEYTSQNAKIEMKIVIKKREERVQS
jgi:hypothetical protein